MRTCNCPERRDKDGKPYPETEFSHLHDCLYVQKRNTLIQKAEGRVIDSYGFNMPGGRFTRLYAAEMESLAQSAGLTNVPRGT